MASLFTQPRSLLWISIFIIFFVWSGVNPRDQLVWLLEVSPAIIAASVMLFSYERFPLTSLLYYLILIHAIILMIGGHYTYAEVPLFESIQDFMGWQRNNYDKLGHFAQGFVPALVVREILKRHQIVTRFVWCNFLSICCALSFSALYEMIEWWIALISDQAAEAFLGTQGYVWDTQSDMGWALLGALLAVTFLSHLHDRQIQMLSESQE